MTNDGVSDLQTKLGNARLTAMESVWANYSAPGFAEWLKQLRSDIRSVDTEYERSLDLIAFSPAAISVLVTKEAWQDAFRNGLSQALRLIDAAILQLEERGKPTVDQRSGPNQTGRAKEIFIVHGRDNECKQAVARFVEKLRFEAVMLAEQAGGGLSLMEKLEVSKDVVYAIILLTPDDVGGLRSAEAQQPRARQNVIFEFGYFVGRLGRNRVCAIMKEMVEQPSNILGLKYIEFDQAGSWQQSLLRELKHLEPDLDANLAFQP